MPSRTEPGGIGNSVLRATGTGLADGLAGVALSGRGAVVRAGFGAAVRLATGTAACDRPESTGASVALVASLAERPLDSVQNLLELLICVQILVGGRHSKGSYIVWTTANDVKTQ